MFLKQVVFFSACFFALQEAEISAADVTIQWLQQEALEPGPTVCSPCQMALSKNGGYRDITALPSKFSMSNRFHGETMIDQYMYIYIISI